MTKNIFSRLILLISACVFLMANTSMAFGPTITQNGYWNSISSFQVIQAKIDDKNERICLPKIVFKDDVDQEALKKQIQDGIQPQEAIFHLYHDGLGRPKKQGEMYYASDVYLKAQKITYTGYLRKLGYKFSIGTQPAFEDKEFMRDVLYNKHITDLTAEQKKEDEKSGKDKGGKNGQTEKKGSTMRVTTIFDVLPKGVIPPRIRQQQEEIARRVNALKNRPYETETVQIDPLRWAAGKMGLLRADGVISGANIEGQKPELFITPPVEEGWLTAEMIGELNGQPCEFVLQRYSNGLEVFENSRYFLRDIYFSNMKLSWEEWLQKHGKTFREPEMRPSFASGTIEIPVKLVTGKMNNLKAAVLCQVDFAEAGPLTGKVEMFRIFPPQPRPKNFSAFATRFNQLFQGKEVDVSMLVCPDGQPYHELGQKRARRMYFPEAKATLEMIENDLVTGKLK